MTFRTTSGLLLFLVTVFACQRQTDLSLLRTMELVPLPERIQAADAFRSARPSSPLFIDDTTVVLLYMGSDRSVTMAGDANSWNPFTDSLHRIDGTDLWYLDLTYPSSARLEYKFVIDGEEWILDPRNPHTSLGGFGANSELRMPAYAPPAEIDPVAGRPQGSLIDTTIISASFGEERTVTLYVPAEEYLQDVSGLVLVHDGEDFIQFARMPTILDNLISERSIPPVIAVFLRPVERSREYEGDKLRAHSSFVAREIVPMVRSRFGLSNDPTYSVVLGVSSGGNVALAVGLSHPGLFGNIAAFSSNVIPAITEHIAANDRLPLRLYLDVGLFDIPVLIPRVRGLRDLLMQKGYPLMYREYPDSHSYANWRAHIDDALVYLLAR